MDTNALPSDCFVHVWGQDATNCGIAFGHRLASLATPIKLPPGLEMNKERCPKCLVDDQYCDVSCRFKFECGTTNVQGNSTQHTDNCFIGYFSANCRTCSFQFRKISSQRRALSVQWAKATHTLESGGCRTVSLPSCIGLGNARQGFN